MKGFVTSILIIFPIIFCSAQGIEFFHGTWAEALEKAEQEDKIIFVDAFTTWCGPCKAMAAHTFPDPEVGAFFNQYFISMKLDMEKEPGLQFRQKFPVSAYPTLFFIDSREEVVLKSVGGKKPEELLQIAESVLAKYDKSTRYEAAYASGDRSYDLVYNYIAALNKAGKPSVRIANDYFASQTDLSTPDNLKFILEAAILADCQGFELLEKYKNEIVNLTSKEIVLSRIRLACANTVKRAIEFESADLLNFAFDAMQRHLPSEADAFKTHSEIYFGLAIHDLSHIEELINHHVRRHIKDDDESLHQLALDLNKYAPEDPVCSKLAIELASKAAKNNAPKYISTYAQLVHRSGAKQEALEILENAIKRYGGDESDKELQNLRALKSRIENS